MRLETKIQRVGLREGYADTNIDPTPFVRPYEMLAQTGRDIQNLGRQAHDWVLTEQKVYNATQVDLLNIERKTKMNAFLNLSLIHI